MRAHDSTSSGDRPFVLINMAMTADGKIATANRAVTTFGSEADRQHMFALRATADAILCGAKTIAETGAILDHGGEKFRRLRLRKGLAEHPLRLIASGSGSLDPAARLFQHRFSPILVLTTRRASAARLDALRAVADAVKICGPRKINFRAALRWLFEHWHIRRLLCEGGGELNDALFRAGVVDEIHLTICPRIFGGRTAPSIADGIGFPRLAGAAKFEIKSIREKNGELFTVFSRTKIDRAG